MFVYCEEFNGGEGTIHVCHIEPVEEEKKVFTKSDLKDFMRVQYRDGDVRIYACGSLHDHDGEHGCSINRFDEGLKGCLVPDIVKVWNAPSHPHSLFNLNHNGAILFDREKEEASGKKQKEIEEAENRIKEAKALLEEATAHLNKLKEN